MLWCEGGIFTKFIFCLCVVYIWFFFSATATTEIYTYCHTLSLHDALPILLVAGDGAVENRVIDIPAGLNPSALVEAGNYISATLSGLTLTEAMARVRHEIEAERIAIDRAAQDLVSRGLAIWSSDGADRPVLIVRGQANLLDENAVGDPARVGQRPH